MKGPSKKDFIAVGVIIIVVIITSRLEMFDSKPIVGGKDSFLPEYFYLETSGIVTAKYIDSTNHNWETIEFYLNDSIECFYLFWGKDLELYNYISVGDSIFKKSKAKEITIIKASKDSLFRLSHFD